MIEIIVTLVVLGIALAIGAASFISWLPNYRLKAASRDLYSNMLRAKSEAVKRNCSVGVVFTTVTYPVQGGGYTVFLDNGSGTNAGNATLDSDETELFDVQMPHNCTLYEADFSGDAATSFNSRGFPVQDTTTGTPKTGTVKLRNDNSVWYRMTLTSSGYPKIERSDDGSW